MIIATERRSSPRFPAVAHAAVAEFSVRGRSRIVGASLINISISGALLRMRERPALGATVWLALLRPVRTPFQRATVVRLDDDEAAGVAFAQACNRTLFWTATRGEDFRSVFPAEPDPGQWHFITPPRTAESFGPTPSCEGASTS